MAGEFWVEVIVEVSNKRGALASLATAISEAKSNIGNIKVDPRDGQHNSVAFSLSVNDRGHLARIMRRLKADKHVLRLHRLRQGGN